MKLAMEEEVTFVHVLFDNKLILVCVFTPYNQIIFRSDEPAEFLEPEYFPIFIGVLHHSNLMFLKIAHSGLLGLLNGDHSGIFSLFLLVIGLLLDFEVLTNVKLSWDAQIDVDLHDRIEVCQVLIIDLKHLVLLLILVYRVENQRYALLF